MQRSMEMMAAVVDRDRRNANWSVKQRVGGGWRSAGCKKCWTTVRSIIHDKTGVIEIGRKSE